MIVSIHQPAYLPWLGYFDRIAASDMFIFLDTVQFETNSFINRNRIKTASGPLWLTVPVLARDHLDKTLVDMKIDSQRDWRRKHLLAIKQNYQRAACFANRYERLAATYSIQSDRLVNLCYSQLSFWLSEFAISTHVRKASCLGADERKSDLILALCRRVGASTYLSGPMGREYLRENEFIAAGIEVRYQDYVHPQYSQLFGPFLPALSIVDYWLNCVDLGLFRRNP